MNASFDYTFAQEIAIYGRVQLQTDTPRVSEFYYKIL